MSMILLRYGELALKGRNRVEFVRRLRNNVRSALKAHGIEGQVVSAGQRVYVRTDRVEEALEPISRVFGLVSLSPVVEVPRDMDAIAAECVRQAKAAGVAPEISFRVRARRSDKTFPFISPDINRLAGEAIYRETQGRVDLSDSAQVTIGVEVSSESALVYGRIVPAHGGLPVGVEGRVVALVSGGIDSPVAAWMMMKRGCGVIPLHFQQNEVETGKTLDNLEVLRQYSYGWNLRPVFVDHAETVAPTLQALRELGEERWSCIFCKRAMIRKACEVADELHAQAVVLGDALGQVASQTLHNLEVVSYGMPKLILRPLIGLDKGEIIQLAQRIGTFELSTRSSAGCAFLPAHPLTQATVEGLQRVAERLAEMGG